MKFKPGQLVTAACTTPGVSLSLTKTQKSWEEPRSNHLFRLGELAMVIHHDAVTPEDNSGWDLRRVLVLHAGSYGWVPPNYLQRVKTGDK
jgi:hypothetical protein